VFLLIGLPSEGHVTCTSCECHTLASSVFVSFTTKTAGEHLLLKCSKKNNSTCLVVMSSWRHNNDDLT
jgi:hypothetical protein